MFKRLRKVLKWLLVVAVCWCVWCGWRIGRGANLDETRRADAAVVLGAAAYGDKPSPVFEQRIAHGVALYKNGTVKKLILTGGYGEGAKFSESEVARLYALEHGVPESALLLEKKSRTTLENLRYARELMKEHGLKSALLVSDPLHMERSVRMMKDLGIAAWRSPTPTTRYVSLESRAGFLIREVYAMTVYLVGGI